MIYAYIFFIGTIFGSFVNVYINRSVREESIIYPPSHCDNCKKKLEFYELIPIISFILLKGRCSRCGAKIGWESIFAEVTCGLLAIISYLINPSMIAIFLFFALLLGYIISLIDIKTMEIYNFHIYLLIILGIIYRFVYLGFEIEFFSHIILFSLAFFICYYVSKKSMGDGDYFFYLGLGLFLYDEMFITFILASIYLGAIYGVIKAIKYKNIKLKIPFCIFIYLSFILNILIYFWRNIL